MADYVFHLFFTSLAQRYTDIYMFIKKGASGNYAPHMCLNIWDH